MKQIEKENGQIFEIYESRKDLKENLNFDWLFDEKEIWHDEDSSLEIVYTDGSRAGFGLGDKKQPLRLNRIAKICYINSATNAIYNCDIVYNKHYEDYDVEI